MGNNTQKSMTDSKVLTKKEKWLEKGRQYKANKGYKNDL